MARPAVDPAIERDARAMLEAILETQGTQGIINFLDFDLVECLAADWRAMQADRDDED